MKNKLVISYPTVDYTIVNFIFIAVHTCVR